MVLQRHDATTFEKLRYPVPDVYFSAEYGMAEEESGAGPWLMLEAYEGRWLMPVHIRDDPAATDAVSPYGYSGIYAAPELTHADTLRAWHEATEALRAAGCVSVFVRQSPLLPNQWNAPGAEWVVRRHPTIQLDVTDVEDAWNGMKGRSRTSIRKAEKLGLTSSVRPAEPSTLHVGSSFRQLYEAGMLRREASERYLFPDAYYQKLLEKLGQNLLIAEVRTDAGSGEVVASSLLMRHGRQLHYHLSGSQLEAGRSGATNELIWGAMRWGHESGVHAFHLGGGLGEGDSLFKFKASFGGEVLDYSAYGVVVDEAAYTKATAARAVELGVAVHELENREGSFPKYRMTI